MIMDKIKLFCIPYAGGSSIIFNSWKEKFSGTNVEVIPLELPGRGNRFSEPLSNSMDDAINDIFYSIKNQSLTKYAIFGHSLGGLIGYHVARKIILEQMTRPLHIFFSGVGAPQIKEEKKHYETMSDEKFKEELIVLGGTPPSFFEYPELVDLFTPILKSDFILAESDVNYCENTPLPFNISVFLGSDDELTHEQCSAWQENTSKSCTIYFLKGGHFFINEHENTIIKRIKNTIEEYL